VTAKIIPFPTRDDDVIPNDVIPNLDKPLIVGRRLLRTDYYTRRHLKGRGHVTCRARGCRGVPVLIGQCIYDDSTTGGWYQMCEAHGRDFAKRYEIEVPA